MKLKEIFYKYYYPRDELTDQLVMSVERGDASRAQALVNAGAPLDKASLLTATPLTQAVWRGDTELVGLLLKKGADPNFPDKQGRSPLSCAINSFRLRDKEKVKAEDHDALPVLRLLLDAGADVNAMNEFKTMTIRQSIQEGPETLLEEFYTKWEAAHKAAEEERRNTPPKVDLSSDITIRRPLSFRFKKP